MNSGQSARTFLQALIIPAWWIIALFGSAGHITWTRGWVCTVLYLGAMYASRAVLKKLYVGLILLHVAMSLILCLIATLGIAAAIATLLFWRTVFEDRTLRRELPGYEDYTSITRYRLMPGIW